MNTTISVSTPTPTKMPRPKCPEGHPDVVALILNATAREIRHLSSSELIDEREHLVCEVLAAEADDNCGADVRITYRHRLKIADAEIARRRRLARQAALGAPNR